MRGGGMAAARLHRLLAADGERNAGRREDQDGSGGGNPAKELHLAERLRDGKRPVGMSIDIATGSLNSGATGARGADDESALRSMIPSSSGMRPATDFGVPLSTVASFFGGGGAERDDTAPSWSRLNRTELSLRAP